MEIRSKALEKMQVNQSVGQQSLMMRKQIMESNYSSRNISVFSDARFNNHDMSQINMDNSQNKHIVGINESVDSKNQILSQVIHQMNASQVDQRLLYENNEQMKLDDNNNSYKNRSCSQSSI